MRNALLLVLLIVAACIADAPRARAGAIEITYLGTNAYLIKAPGCSLLVDPYFTRVPFARAALDLQVTSDPTLVESALREGRIPRKIDGVLVTHGHVDHLLDVPEVMRRVTGRLIASPSSVALVESMGVPAARCVAAEWGRRFRVGSACVTVLPAIHDRILGRVPFPGESPRRVPPVTASDWVCGLPLAFLIEVDGRRIYIDSGGTPEMDPPAVGKVDLAIIGVALPDARKRLPKFLARLAPTYFLPSHQDDFFRPLTHRFVFGPLTDFATVKRVASRTSSHLVFLHPFEKWTLP